MTFLNPLVLLGIITAAIPVILHLLNLRKLRTIEFSTLTFLKELQQTKIRRLKLRQLLLLLLRTLLIVLLVLAFARPAFHGSLFGTIGTNARTTYVIILDDSYSMAVSDEHGERFHQAKQVCESLINLLNEGDEVFLIKLSDIPRATIEPATHDFAALRVLIGESKPSAIRRTLDDALRLSAKLLAQSNNANKEIYVISDFQKTLIENANIKSQSIGYFDERVRFFILNIGEEDVVDNASIDSVQVVTKIIEQNTPVTLNVFLRNYGDAPLKNHVVSIFVDGVRTAQQAVNIEPWSSGMATFVVTPKRAGILKGHVELENDLFEADNKRYFTFAVPEQLNVVVVPDVESDDRFIQFALRSALFPGKSLMNVERVTPKQFSTVDFSRVDVVMMVGVNDVSPGVQERIKGFVERGGGMIFFPNSKGEFPASLLSELSLPRPDGMIAFDRNSGSLTFSKVDVDHPLFATVFEASGIKKQQTDEIESPIIEKTLQWSVGAAGHAVIHLNNGKTFFSEHLFGEGKILFCSVAPVLSWSDFPLKGIFVPLVYRSVIYAASKGKSTESYYSGDTPLLTIPQQQRILREGQYSVVSTKGVEEFLTPPSTLHGKTVIQLPLLEAPDIYDVRVASTMVTSFAVNLDGKESDGRKFSDTEFESLWKQLGVLPTAIQAISQVDRLHETVLKSRFGVELWKYCIAIALILTIVEMIIARDSRKELEALVKQGVIS
jgi:hypothetical protein